MGQTAKAPRQNRTITVDFQDPSTYFELLSNGKAFVEFVLAFILSIGFQLTHKATCTGGGCGARRSQDASDEYSFGSSAQRHGPEVIRDEGIHHPGGSQAAFLTGLAHLYNLIPYQRRALNAGKCGVEVEGGVLPTPDWMINLQLLTSGGYQCASAPPDH